MDIDGKGAERQGLRCTCGKHGTGRGTGGSGLHLSYPERLQDTAWPYITMTLLFVVFGQSTFREPGSAGLRSYPAFVVIAAIASDPHILNCGQYFGRVNPLLEKYDS
jgi:hypothetical protein